MKRARIVTISATSLLLLVILQKTSAYPKPQEDQEEDEEEEDSSENQIQKLNKVLANHFGLAKNASDQEIVDKATTFLAQYFTGGGGSAAIQSSSSIARGGEDDSAPPPPKQNRTIIITIVDSKNKTEGINAAELNLENLGFSGRRPAEATQQQETNKVNHQNNPAPPHSTYQVITKNKPEIENNNNGQGLEIFDLIVGTSPIPIVPETSTIAPISVVTDSAFGQHGLDNIEDAILEALSVAQASEQQQQQQSVISGQINPQQQQQQQYITIGQNVLGIPNIDGSAIQLPAAGADQNGAPIIFVSQYVPPPPPPTTTPRTAPSIFGAFSRIIGSIAHGNLGGAIQNSVKLAEVPEIQDTAAFAVGGVLQTLATGVSTGLQSGLATGITSGIRSGITSGLNNNRRGGDLTAGISSGLSSGLATGIVNGVNCQILGNCPTLPPPSLTVFRNVPNAYKKFKKTNETEAAINNEKGNANENEEKEKKE